jgi:hypothetical protein
MEGVAMTGPEWFVVTDPDGNDVRDRFTWRKTGDAWEGTAREGLTAVGRVFLPGDVLRIPVTPELIQ